MTNNEYIKLLIDENFIGAWEGGWLNGEWKCEKCGTIIGKNLKNESPHASVSDHKGKCSRGVK